MLPYETLWNRNNLKAQTYFKSTINQSNLGSIFNSLKLYVNVHTVYYSVLSCQTSPKNVNLLLKFNFVGLHEKPIQNAESIGTYSLESATLFVQ